MASRPVFHPELGAFFRAWREEKTRYKQRQAASLLTRRGLTVSHSALQLLESGRIKNPDPDMIRALAKLYGAPVDEFIGRVTKATQGMSHPDTGLVLDRHHPDNTGGAHVDPQAQARIVELQAAVKTLTRTLATVAKHAEAITEKVRASGVEEVGLSARKSSGTRSHR